MLKLKVQRQQSAEPASFYTANLNITVILLEQMTTYLCDTYALMSSPTKQSVSICKFTTYELISWHKAILLSNKHSQPDILPLSPLNLVLRSASYITVCGVAFLRKHLQEGKALVCVYISNLDLQNRSLDSWDSVHGSVGVHVSMSHHYV